LDIEHSVCSAVFALRQASKHYGEAELYNYISRPYRTVNTLRLSYETIQLMLYTEIIAVCFQTHTKHINTLCGQNVELMNDKPGGTNSNHWTLK
jgi:hypothetical protein